MAAPWKTVRVFISSTFRDMHAERDHLIKVVFPKLRQWCEKRRLHLVERAKGTSCITRTVTHAAGR
jgi:Domain of unknown function (DUF4062)